MTMLTAKKAAYATNPFWETKGCANATAAYAKTAATEPVTPKAVKTVNSAHETAAVRPSKPAFKASAQASVKTRFATPVKTAPIAQIVDAQKDKNAGAASVRLTAPTAPAIQAKTVETAPQTAPAVETKGAFKTDA